MNGMELFNNGHDVADFSMGQSPYTTAPSIISTRDAQTASNIPLREAFSSQSPAFPLIYPPITTNMNSPGVHNPNDDNATMLQNPYSSEMVSPNGTLPMGSNIWESAARASPPAWISGDFDINALNNSFTVPMGIGMGDQFQAHTSSDILQYALNPPEMAVHILGRSHRHSSARTKTVRKAWFTYVDEDEKDDIQEPSLARDSMPMRGSVNSAEESTNRDSHDNPDDFRSSVSQKLLVHTNNGTLPSENYLVS